jgi:hypothetical protein
LDGNACSACAPGTYKKVNGSAPCSLCEDGKFSHGNVSSCTKCPVNSHSPEGSILINCLCNAGYAPKLIEATQWVSSVDRFSPGFKCSSRSSGIFPTSACLVGPDGADCSSTTLEPFLSSACLLEPESANPNQFLELSIKDAIFVGRIDIFETNASGACREIKLYNAGNWVTVWKGHPREISGARVFSPPIQWLSSKTNSIRLELI